MRGTDQRTCPHCGDGQWMYVEGSVNLHSLVDDVTLRCPACSIEIPLAPASIDRTRERLHVVRPELIGRHRLSLAACRCGAHPAVGHKLVLGLVVWVHYDNGVPQ